MKNKPSVAFCAYGLVGTEIIYNTVRKYDNSHIKFVITHPNDDRLLVNSINVLCNKRNIPTVSLSANDENMAVLLKQYNIDILFLLWWPEILKKEIIKIPSGGVINTHPSYLPHGRGKHPYFWAIVNDTPYGVTLHFINEKIDSGYIIAQKEIPIKITDTGQTLYEKSKLWMINLFDENYLDILSKNYAEPIKVDDPKDFNLSYSDRIENTSEILLDKEYKAKDLINIIRARSFKARPSAYFYDNGKKYYIRIEIEEIKK